MTALEQYNRTLAYINMTDEIHANCEECGAIIPVELTLCDNCAEEKFNPYEDFSK